MVSTYYGVVCFPENLYSIKCTEMSTVLGQERSGTEIAGSFKSDKTREPGSVLRNGYRFSGQVKVKQKMDSEVWFHVKNYLHNEGIMHEASIF
jgi:hypothetical protein